MCSNYYETSDEYFGDGWMVDIITFMFWRQGVWLVVMGVSVIHGWKVAER